MKIDESASRYEAWLLGELHGELVQADLDEKHEKMKESAFVFLRATYWRWAEVVPALCPALVEGPAVLAVGDMHVENFGTWRDADGRLVWGVNDFDEAAEMPYALDLARLAVSAFLGQSADGSGKRPTSLAAICKDVVEGYAEGLARPEPYVLDRDHARMREMFVASEKDRAKFWKKIDAGKAQAEAAKASKPPKRLKQALDAALPPGAARVAYWPRAAGTGSLGRPRWAALAQWQGGPVVREAKAIVPSGWAYAHNAKGRALRVVDIACGRYRAPDPWLRLADDGVLVRRLSPNNHKIEVDALGASLFEHRLIKHMGSELAAVHLGVGTHGDALRAHLQQRKGEWLRDAAALALEAVGQDFEDWKAS